MPRRRRHGWTKRTERPAAAADDAAVPPLPPSSAEQPAAANLQQAVADKARRVTLRIVAAANRSSWCSACELQTFIQTGAAERKTYKPKRTFLRRLAAALA